MAQATRLREFIDCSKYLNGIVGVIQYRHPFEYGRAERGTCNKYQQNKNLENSKMYFDAFCPD